MLTLKEIKWPGGSSRPPKGVPESYHLRVATYIEEPHVTYKLMPASGVCDQHATVCEVYLRDGTDKRFVVSLFQF